MEISDLLLVRKLFLCSRSGPARSRTLGRYLWVCTVGLIQITAFVGLVQAEPRVVFPEFVDVYDLHEIPVRDLPPSPGNPFVDSDLRGHYEGPGGGITELRGFCDSRDGSLYRIRFTPRRAGDYEFHLILDYPGGTFKTSGRFRANSSFRRGFVNIDPEYPRRLKLDDGSRPYFVSKTAWLLMGSRRWREFIDLAAENNINVLRFGLEVNYYYQRVGIDVWPWSGTRVNPDYSRFDLATWRKFDDVFRYAMERGVYLEPVIFTSVRRNLRSYKYGILPDREMEPYWRYLMSRLGAYPNIVFFQIFNEFGRNKLYQTYAAEYLERMSPFNHLITTSAGTTDRAIWPELKWNKLAVNHSCTSSDPRRHGLKDYYYRVGRSLSQINKPGWIDESGRIRHGNVDPVYRRKEYWTWSMADVYWNYHSEGGCEDIEKIELGPAEDVVRYIRPFWEKYTEWWKMEATDTLVEGYSGVDFVFAKISRNPAKSVLYLVNERSGARSDHSRIRLNLPTGTYGVQYYEPSQGIFHDQRLRLIARSTDAITLEPPSFQDDLVVLLIRES